MISLVSSLSRLLPQTAPLGAVASPGNATDYVGHAYVLTRMDDAERGYVVFALFCDYQASGGDGQASMVGYLLTSFDNGCTWFQAAALPAIQSGHRSELIPVNGLGSLVAFVTRLAGTPKPTQTFTARLCCSVGFRLSPAAPGVVVSTIFAPAVSPSPAPVEAGDLALRTVTTSGAINTGDRIVLLDASAGPFTFTLSPASARPGRPLTLKRVNDGPNVPTVAALPGDTIERAATLPLLVQGEAADLFANGHTDWCAH